MSQGVRDAVVGWPLVSVGCPLLAAGAVAVCCGLLWLVVAICEAHEAASRGADGKGEGGFTTEGAESAEEELP